jgi:hypothetical protein
VDAEGYPVGMQSVLCMSETGRLRCADTRAMVGDWMCVGVGGTGNQKWRMGRLGWLIVWCEVCRMDEVEWVNLLGRQVEVILG